MAEDSCTTTFSTATSTTFSTTTGRSTVTTRFSRDRWHRPLPLHRPHPPDREAPLSQPPPSGPASSWSPQTHRAYGPPPTRQRPRRGARPRPECAHDPLLETVSWYSPYPDRYILRHTSRRSRPTATTGPRRPRRRESSRQTPPLRMVERGPGGEARVPYPRPRAASPAAETARTRPSTAALICPDRTAWA